jgi:methylated-DNA-protein-cysteine methyltransferase related protein
VVEAIPPGRVTTYGHIAQHLSMRSAARAVGWELNKAIGTGLPCHRVVNRRGALSGTRHVETPMATEERLRTEGVTFNGEGEVLLDRHLWSPAEGAD